MSILSIVIVNSDNTDITLACLESIYKYPPSLEYEVILVDNHSDPSCLPVVNLKFPQVVTVDSSIRQGFAKNYNIGLRLSRGEYVIILNNDTLIHPGAFDSLVKSFHSPNVGMAGPKLLSRTGAIQTDSVRSFPTPWYYIGRMLWLDQGSPLGKINASRIRKKISQQKSGIVEAISGSCMLVSRSALEKVGLLDEGYDFYYEDIEWCHRFHKNGFSIAYVEEAQVTHLHDQSLSKVKVWAKQSEYRSALRYFRQYYQLSKAGAYILWLVTVIGFMNRAVFFTLYDLITRQNTHAQAYRNLVKWILTHSPSNNS